MTARNIPPGITLASTLAVLWLAGLVFAVPFVVYTSFPSCSNEYDSIFFAREIEHGPTTYVLYHPHHLLYPSMGWHWIRLERALGIQDRALASLQRFNAILSAAGVTVLFLLARLATGRLLPALGAALGLAVSYTWWNSAIDATVRPIGALSLVLAALFALLACRKAAWRWIPSGIFLGFGVLSHQANVLLTVPLAACALAQARVPWRRRIAAAVVVAVTGAVVSLAGYGLVGTGLLGLRSAAGYVRWTTAYLHVGGGSGGKNANAFIGRLYPSETMTQWQRASFGWSRSLLGVNDGARLLSGGITVRRARAILLWWSLLVAATGLPLVIASLPSPPPAKRAPPDRARDAFVLAAGWLGAFVPFFYSWEPGNIQYWVYVLPALWLLFALVWARLANVVRAPGAAVVWRTALAACLLVPVGALGWWNLDGQVLKESQPTGSFYHRLLGALDQVGRSHDVLLVVGISATPLYLDYYGRMRYFTLSPALWKATGTPRERVALVRRQLEEFHSAGKRVLCLNEVVSMDSGEVAWIEGHSGVTPALWKELFAGLDIRRLPGAPGTLLREVVWP